MTDLSPAIKEFAREHEAEIKQRAKDMLDEFFATTTIDSYIEKFDQGAAEHGEMTLEKLTESIWTLHACAEMKDLWWYVAMGMLASEYTSPLANGEA